MSYEYAIIGGGITGLALAYNLSKMVGDRKRIVLFEKGYIGSGSSTRNAGRYRVHFGSMENTVFAIKSAEYLKMLERELGYNFMMWNSGYIWLVYSEEQLKFFENKNNMYWKKLGIPVSFIGPEEMKQNYPFINTKQVIAGVYGSQDGSFHHDAIIHGLWRKLSKTNVKISENSPVVRVRKENGYYIIEGPGFSAKAENIIVAAGGWSPKILEQLNISLPLVPVRKEIMVTEPFKFRIKEFIIYTRRNLYFSQTIKGELIGSASIEPKKTGVVDLNTTATWLLKFSTYLSEIIKPIHYVRVMRVWSGYYVMTPDKSHILGRSKDWPDGIYYIGGFSGHGFMMGPYAAKLLSEYIVSGKIPGEMKPFLPERFPNNKLIKEDMVVG